MRTRINMKSSHKIAIAIIAALVLVVGGLRFWVSITPLRLDLDGPAGKVFDSVSECAHKQKDLFLCIQAYKEKHGQLPHDIDALINGGVGALAFINCPLGPSYKIYFENYGKPDAVFIAETQNKHPNTFMLWFRGIKPCVQTMGDSTIYLFEDGKFATIQAKKF